jgi:hypothetical protein
MKNGATAGSIQRRPSMKSASPTPAIDLETSPTPAMTKIHKTHGRIRSTPAIENSKIGLFIVRLSVARRVTGYGVVVG